MIPGKFSGLVTCIAAAGMGMFVAIWLLDFALIRTEWCNGSEAVCFRDWLGALSGWVAAIGALFATWLTVRKLREQISEQKRQTDFMLGDASPTMDSIVDIKNPKQVVLRIVNWNRRAFQVHEIETHDIGAALIMKSAKMNGKNYTSQFTIINGWENKNIAPDNFHFKISIVEKTKNKGYAEMEDFPKGTRITVRGILFSESHQPLELTCYLHPQVKS